jgi:hypothetical protein
MVFVVVNFHGPGIDVRLKRIRRIGERRNRKWTGRRRLGCGGGRLSQHSARRIYDDRDTRSSAEKMTTRQ